MKKREYIAKFLGDLSKIIFGTVIVSQLFSPLPNFYALLIGLLMALGLFIASLIIHPE
jgi:uncharacterized RDD family membrane protein YckC